MATAVRIPKATITLEEANVLGWRKQPGERVRKDEILFEMETDKVVMEVPAPVDGVLLRIEVNEGTARVDQAVAWLGEPGEAIPDEAEAVDVVLPVAPSVRGPVETVASGTLSASPAARRRARELGVDLAKVQATGPGGRITERDVERARQS